MSFVCMELGGLVLDTGFCWGFWWLQRGRATARARTGAIDGSLRPSGCTPAFGRVEAGRGGLVTARVNACPSASPSDVGGGVKREQTTAKTEADPYGMTNKRTSNGNGNDKDKSWLGEVIHSHPWRDEAAPWMGHPCGYGGERRADRFAIAMGHPGKSKGKAKMKYRDLSTAQRTISPSVAPVEMTFVVGEGAKTNNSKDRSRSLRDDKQKNKQRQGKV